VFCREHGGSRFLETLETYLPSSEVTSLNTLKANMRKLDGILYPVFWGKVRTGQVRGKVLQFCNAETLKEDEFKRFAKNDY
jgi:hypothetical protein